MTSDETTICNRGEFILTAIFVMPSTSCAGIRSNVWRSVNCHSIHQPAAILPYSVGCLPVYKLYSYVYCNKCYCCFNPVFTAAAVYAVTPDPYSKTPEHTADVHHITRDTSVSLFDAWSGLRCGLSDRIPSPARAHFDFLHRAPTGCGTHHADSFPEDTVSWSGKLQCSTIQCL